MNRAFPALGLLLGTLAAALVAVGVARDLERAGSRPSTPTVGYSHPPIGIMRPASIERTRSFDWQRWSQPLSVVPQMSTAVKPIMPVKRVIVDWNSLAATVARAGDTTLVDALIRTSDGIDDARERDLIPFGHVMVGGRLVKLEHRGRRLEVGEAWTVRLHYDSDRRQVLTPPSIAASLTLHRVAGLPDEKRLLWSDDCRTLIHWTNQTAKTGWNRLFDSLHRADDFVTLTTWSQRSVNDGWDRLAGHVKRQVWLATMSRSPKATPVHSAERVSEGKR